MSEYLSEYERQKELIYKNKKELIRKRELAKKEYIEVENIDDDRKNAKIRLLNVKLARYDREILKLEAEEKMIRPGNIEDKEYRYRQYNFASRLQKKMPKNLDLRYYGCSLYTTSEILKKGKIQATFINTKTLETIIREYTKLHDSLAMPAGCIFVIKNVDGKYTDKLLKVIDLKSNDNELFAIISTLENIEKVKSWAISCGIDSNMVHDFVSFEKYITNDEEKKIEKISDVKTKLTSEFVVVYKPSGFKKFIGKLKSIFKWKK